MGKEHRHQTEKIKGGIAILILNKQKCIQDKRQLKIAKAAVRKKGNASITFLWL